MTGIQQSRQGRGAFEWRGRDPRDAVRRAESARRDAASASTAAEGWFIGASTPVEEDPVQPARYRRVEDEVWQRLRSPPSASGTCPLVFSVPGLPARSRSHPIYSPSSLHPADRADLACASRAFATRTVRPQSHRAATAPRAQVAARPGKPWHVLAPVAGRVDGVAVPVARLDVPRSAKLGCRRQERRALQHRYARGDANHATNT